MKSKARIGSEPALPPAEKRNGACRGTEPADIGVEPAFVDQHSDLDCRLDVASGALQPYQADVGSAGENSLKALRQRPGKAAGKFQDGIIIRQPQLIRNVKLRRWRSSDNR